MKLGSSAEMTNRYSIFLFGMALRSLFNWFEAQNGCWMLIESKVKGSECFRAQTSQGA